MEKPKARLTIEQHQQAINEAIWIDASPLEWPTVDKMWLLCSALIDSVQMVDYLRISLAAVEAERDAARRRVQDCETRMMRYAIELAEMQAERDAARAEAERLREDAARNRWCEEMKADVCYLGACGEWTVEWEVSRTQFAHKINRDRNAAIDAARGAK